MKGYIFPNGGGKPLHQSNFQRREFHPALKSANIPRCGLHAFRRYRNTYLRNVAGCPDGLLKFWLGHSDQSMSDRYDKVGQGANAEFRLAQAKAMGVGFKLPANLKELQNRRKIVVQHVVQHLESKTKKSSEAA